MVQVSLTVGKLDASLALLLTKDHHLIEFPTLLLPQDVEAGSIVTISCEKDSKLETNDKKVFKFIQDEIVTSFALRKPIPPVLRIKNVTQTSVVLEWDPIDVATADIISLTLYKNNSRFGVIPTPLKRTGTKLSGLAIDNSYVFHLVLRTTAGIYESEKVTVRTHKMTDLSGITVCVGSLENSEITRSDLEETAIKIGAKPLQDLVKLDTTHFICTEPEGPQCKRAQDLNIPVVRPEWLKACESERRLVGVRAYYLNADPKLRAPAFQRSRATSQATISSTSPSSAVGGSSVRNETIRENSLEQNEDTTNSNKKVHENGNGNGNGIQENIPQENGDHNNNIIPTVTVTPATETKEEEVTESTETGTENVDDTKEPIEQQTSKDADDEVEPEIESHESVDVGTEPISDVQEPVSVNDATQLEESEENQERRPEESSTLAPKEIIDLTGESTEQIPNESLTSNDVISVDKESHEAVITEPIQSNSSGKKKKRNKKNKNKNKPQQEENEQEVAEAEGEEGEEEEEENVESGTVKPVAVDSTELDDVEL